jgi:fructosamine-3-kinase
MITECGSALIDLVCVYVDREMEFGITTLFGGFSRAFWSAYEEAWPLPAGWRERNALYQLYHLLNHHLIFGGHYGSEALEVARRLA